MVELSGERNSGAAQADDKIVSALNDKFVPMVIDSKWLRTKFGGNEDRGGIDGYGYYRSQKQSWSIRCLRDQGYRSFTPRESEIDKHVRGQGCSDYTLQYYVTSFDLDAQWVIGARIQTKELLEYARSCDLRSHSNGVRFAACFWDQMIVDGCGIFIIEDAERVCCASSWCRHRGELYRRANAV